jgi:hypothetical protein
LEHFFFYFPFREWQNGLQDAVLIKNDWIDFISFRFLSDAALLNCERCAGHLRCSNASLTVSVDLINPYFKDFTFRRKYGKIRAIDAPILLEDGCCVRIKNKRSGLSRGLRFINSYRSTEPASRLARRMAY